MANECHCDKGVFVSAKPILDEDRIHELLHESKPVPTDFMKSAKTKPKANMSYSERELQVFGVDGSDFRLFIRQNEVWPLDFTVGLRFVDKNDLHYVLRRFNGPSHQHTNHLEKRNGDANCSFKGAFHVHMATERYQRAGMLIDGYAEISNKFANQDQAMDLLLKQCAFSIADDGNSKQLTLNLS